MAERIEAVVVGAGVVGLAVARALARQGRETIVLEAAGTIGTEISSRNSEVIHAGIYYPTDSLKASLCVTGRHALYDYCATHGVPHNRLGKLIVAADETEIAVLRGLEQSAIRNGVTDADALQWLTPAEVRRLEPAIACAAALFSPSTGIVDSHALMLAYRGDAEAAGAVLAFNSPLIAASAIPAGFRLRAGGSNETELECAILVNAAGLSAQRVAQSIHGMPQALVPPLHMVKGCYYTLSGRAPFRHLIYPVPARAGLGVHVTLDMAGQVRFGPDTEYIERLDYNVDAGRAQSFYAAIRRYWPDLPGGALQPGYAGIRPKLQGPDEGAKDFVIQGPAEHGVAGLVNLFGIESPGLTASLAIAAETVQKLS